LVLWKTFSVRGFCIIENVFRKRVLYYEKSFFQDVFILWKIFSVRSFYIMENVFWKRGCEDEWLRKMFSREGDMENIFRKHSSSRLLFRNSFSGYEYCNNLMSTLHSLRNAKTKVTYLSLTMTLPEAFFTTPTTTVLGERPHSLITPITPLSF